MVKVSDTSAWWWFLFWCSFQSADASTNWICFRRYKQSFDYIVEPTVKNNVNQNIKCTFHAVIKQKEGAFLYFKSFDFWQLEPEILFTLLQTLFLEKRGATLVSSDLRHKINTKGFKFLVSQSLYNVGRSLKKVLSLCQYSGFDTEIALRKAFRTIFAFW